MNHVAVLIAWALGAAAIPPGAAVLRMLHVHVRPALRLAIAYPVGLVVQAMLTFALVGFGLSGPLLGLALLAPVGLLAQRSLRTWIAIGGRAVARTIWRSLASPRVGGAEHILARALFAMTALGLVGYVVSCAAPVTSADALGYHIQIVRQYALGGTLRPLAHIFESAGPNFGQIVLAPAYALGGEQAAQSVVPLQALVVALAIWAVGRVRRTSGMTALLATAMTLLSLLTVWIATGLYMEEACLVLLAGAYLATYTRARHPAVPWLLCGVLLGSLYSVKYTAGAMVLAVLIAVLAEQFQRGARRRELAVPCLIIGLGIAAAYAPWAVRGVVFVGDPHYPLFRPDAPSMYFSHRGVEVIRTMTESVFSGPRRRELIPVHPLAVPWVGQSHDAGQRLGPLFVGGLLLCLMGAVTRRRWWPLLLGYYVGAIPWAWVSPQTRLYWSVLALVHVPVADGLCRLWERRRDVPRWLVPAGRAIMVTLVGAQVLMGFGATSLRAWQAMRYLAGIENRDEFLSRRALFYSLHRLVAQHLPAGEPVRVLVIGRASYHATYPNLALSYVTPEDLAERNGQSLDSFLCREGITHVAWQGTDAPPAWLVPDLKAGIARVVARQDIDFPMSVVRGSVDLRPGVLVEWRCRLATYAAAPPPEGRPTVASVMTTRASDQIIQGRSQ